MKQGDILESTWGWEQTNADFYIVEKTTDTTAWLRKIGKKVQATGDMTALELPDPQVVSAEKPMRRKIKKWEDSPEYVSINEYAVASAWDGEPVSTSSYA